MSKYDRVTEELAARYWPLHWSKFFTPQRDAEMWFGDELPPSYQDRARWAAKNFRAWAFWKAPEVRRLSDVYASDG